MNSSGESEDAYIPGLSNRGNRRPRVKCKKTSEIVASVPVKQPQVKTYTPKAKMMVSASTVSDDSHDFVKKQKKEISLKDLCAEDKKRVANLIKELARVGEEKENCMHLLKDERENFDKQVMKLVQEQEQALKEREEIQQRLFQCHELLSKYQDQILEKERKLNQSLREQELSPGRVPPHHVPRSGTPISQRSRSPDFNHGRSPQSQRSHSPGSYQGTTPRVFTQARRASLEEIRGQVERPITSMIDKEIAMQRTYENPSTIMADPSNYQQEQPRLRRNFREPVMSSTHKSMEINPYADSNDLVPLIPSPRSSNQGSRGQTPRSSRLEPYQKNKVGFKDKLENDENLQHSPNLQQSQIGDREYMKYYKKLKPAERKRELLKQREKLLEEQNRLKNVLLDQELQLQERQRQLIEKRKQQHERINSLEENRDDGSVFNGRVERLDFDKPLSDDDDIPDEAADMVQQDQRSRHCVATSPRPRTPTTAEKGTSISRMECSVQANIPDTPPKVDVGTSITRMEYPITADDNLHTPPRNDVGTSISRVFPPETKSTPTKIEVNQLIDKMTEVTANLSGSPGGNRQGNLPLPSNRGHSITSPALKAPGDKTLTVVDIVNSMEEDLLGVSNIYQSPAVRGGHTKGSPQVRGLSSPHTRNSLLASDNRRNDFDDESTIEEQEESHILEDIFFLK